MSKQLKYEEKLDTLVRMYSLISSACAYACAGTQARKSPNKHINNH